jgi:AcrR family transcriptional regulator
MADVRRRAILDAAREEFVAKGFAAARLEDIARRANVAKGTIYLSFPDKVRLFEAVLSDHMAPLVERIRDILSASNGVLRPALETMLTAFAEEISSDRTGAVLRLLVSEAIRFPHLGERYFREVVEPTLEQQRRLLARAAQAGELRNPATAEFPQLVMAPIIMGFIWQGVFGGVRPLDIQKLLRIHLDTLFVT